MRALALGGAVGPALFAAVTLGCAHLRPGYSHVHQFISELGATGTAHAWIMRCAGFVPAGLLLAGFGLSLGRLVPMNGLGVLPVALLTLFGVGIAVCGVFSCDPGCPNGTGSCHNLVHDRVAPLSFLAAILATGLLSLRFRRLPGWRSLWLYSAASSGLAFGFFVLMAGSLESRHLTGLWQRLLLATLYLWCAVVGVRAFRQPTPRAADG